MLSNRVAKPHVHLQQGDIPNKTLHLRDSAIPSTIFRDNCNVKHALQLHGLDN